MAEWGAKIVGEGKNAVSDSYDAPAGMLVEIHQTYYFNYLPDENQVLQSTLQTIREGGQTPIYCKVWKDLLGLQIEFQYRSSGFPWILIAIAIISALAVFGIYLATQVAYTVIELIPPEYRWIFIAAVTGIIGLGVYTLFQWTRKK